jgi:hypothetical protein
MLDTQLCVCLRVVTLYWALHQGLAGLVALLNVVEVEDLGVPVQCK